MNKLIRPLPIKYPISSNFGQRIHPITHKNSYHNGIDIAAPNGTNIYSAGNGKVIWLGENKSYGNMVVVEYQDGLLSLYAHMQEICVKNNNFVKIGEIIGKVGNTGHSKGNHLHYEIINGNLEYNGKKVKDKIKLANNCKTILDNKKPLGIEPTVPRENPENYFDIQ